MKQDISNNEEKRIQDLYNVQQKTEIIIFTIFKLQRQDVILKELRQKHMKLN